MVTDGCFTSQIFVAYYTCSPSHYMDHRAKTLERVLMAIGRSPSCPYQLKKEHTHTHTQNNFGNWCTGSPCCWFRFRARSVNNAGPSTWSTPSPSIQLGSAEDQARGLLKDCEGCWKMVKHWWNIGETLVKHWWNTGETSAWHCGQSWELAKGAGGAEQTELQLTVSELQIPMTVRCQCRCISCIEDYEELQSSA